MNKSRYLPAPKDEDLITPVYGHYQHWRQDRIFLTPDFFELERRLIYFVYVPPFYVLFQLEAGDFELFYHKSAINLQPNWWQRLKIRYKIWRLRRKIRKALAKR